MSVHKQIALAVITTAALWAQDGPVFRSETVLVQIEVRATGGNGDPVLDLEKSDFELRENGEPREILSLDYVPLPLRETVEISPREARLPFAATVAPTRIYIETRIGQGQRRRAYRAIRNFLAETPLDAVAVSLRGAPFSSDRDQLLATLETMYEGGGDGVPPLVGVEAAIDEEIANIVKNTGIFTPVVVRHPAPHGHTRRVALEASVIQHWTGLVRNLAVFPGKKMVVLFGRGLRYDSENSLLFDRLSEQALLSRVQFYVIDTRGLLAPIEGGEVMDTGPYDPTLADRAVNREDLVFSQSGVRMLAEFTGGRAVVNSNDFGAVFDRVFENLGGYYVLGYRPGDPDARDHLHRLNVRTQRSGVRLDYLKEYRSEPAFSKLTDKEKGRKLELAAASDAPLNDLPVTVGYELFLGPEGLPVLAYSAGIACKNAPSAQDKKGRRIDLSMLSLAQKLDEQAPPRLVENRLTFVLKEADLERLGGDQSAYFQFSNSLELDPGEYRWRVVIRDETTGAMGASETRLSIPEFAEASSPSSLMLTTRIQPIETGKKKPEKNRASGITIGEIAFLAEAEQVFRPGRTVYSVFGVYHLPEELLRDPPGPRVLLEREGVLLGQPPFEAWQGFVDHEREQIHVVARLNTSGLEPGDYRLSVIVLDGQHVLTRDFRLMGDVPR